ncbi:hypothetical protein L3X38_019033 [Prunus dulcis]|uniref:Uncharacterized protein n=1 Tax=Prunus dulcis TaxID=3755 RepID=A0AAD4WAV2_PRUDU|nr:hypothetical protein L3X38_019033 [Prunus dulcis]
MSRTHALLLPYLSAADFRTTIAALNLTEPFKLSQARKRRSSSISLHIVGPLSNVPRTAFGAPLGLMSTSEASNQPIRHIVTIYGWRRLDLLLQICKNPSEPNTFTNY